MIDNQFMLEARGLAIRAAQWITDEANARTDGQAGAFAGLAASLTLQNVAVSLVLEVHAPGSREGEAELALLYDNAKRDALERWHKSDLKERYGGSTPTGKERETRGTVSGRPPDPGAEPGVPTKERRPDGQFDDHYVLSAEDRAKGYVRPVRLSYKHEVCGGVTSMPRLCAETYAAMPSFYGSTFCCICQGYFPVGAEGKFAWLDDGSKVGT